MTFKQVLSQNKILIMPVAHDVFTALIIQKLGFECLGVGGFGVAASGYGLPDQGYIGLWEISNLVKRISSQVDIPILADGDTGYGDEREVANTIQTLEKSGASAIFIEDQQWPKRCGHTNGKSVIPIEEMVAKLKAALNARQNKDTLIIARTDAIQPEGFAKTIERAEYYIDTGIDGLFIEGLENIEQIETLADNFPSVMKMINFIEGGVTPILSKKEVEELGYNIASYPLTTLLAMYYSIEETLQYLKDQGTTKGYTKLKFFGSLKQLLHFKE